MKLTLDWITLKISSHMEEQIHSLNKWFTQKIQVALKLNWESEHTKHNITSNFVLICNTENKIDIYKDFEKH